MLRVVVRRDELESHSRSRIFQSSKAPYKANERKGEKKNVKCGLCGSNVRQDSKSVGFS